MSFISLTNCERLVLECVWAADGDTPLVDIMEMLKTKYGKEWKRQTISTFLTHLIEKKYVETYRKGRVFYYRPLIAEMDYKNYDAAAFVDSWYQGQADIFLSALHSYRGLTEKETQGIRKLLDSL